jgi:hypothetical protein
MSGQLWNTSSNFSSDRRWADVDHQAAQQGAFAAGDQRDDIADPYGAAIRRQHSVVQAVVAAGLALGHAILLGLGGVVRMQAPLPEAGLQPVR